MTELDRRFMGRMVWVLLLALVVLFMPISWLDSVTLLAFGLYTGGSEGRAILAGGVMVIGAIVVVLTLNYGK